MRKIKKNDEVIIIAGKDKGKRGVVLKVIAGNEKLIVESINMVKRNTKANPAQNKPGGIIEKEMPIHISNVAIWNSVSGTLDHVGIRTLEDGRKVRYFKSSGEVVDI